MIRKHVNCVCSSACASQSVSGVTVTTDRNLRTKHSLIDRDPGDPVPPKNSIFNHVEVIQRSLWYWDVPQEARNIENTARHLLFRQFKNIFKIQIYDRFQNGMVYILFSEITIQTE